MFWSNIFADSSDYKVWDNAPGGEVIDKYERDGVHYVVVVFSHTPSRKYVYVLDTP